MEIKMKMKLILDHLILVSWNLILQILTIFYETFKISLN